MSFFKNKLAVIVVLLSIVFLLVIGFSFRNGKTSFVENGVGVVLNPVQGFIYNVGTKFKNSIGYLTNISTIKRENEMLKKENDELQEKALEYDSLKAQNDRLSSMLNFKSQRKEYKYLGGDIIGKSGGNYIDGLTINRGSSDGLRKGMVAISSSGYLVGQITVVYKNSSIIQTLSNENIAVGCMVQSTGENGIVKGYNNGGSEQLAMIYNLGKDSAVKKGDVVITSGIGGFYPKGLRVGVVTDVENDNGNLSKNAYIQPYIDINKLEEIFIVIPKDVNNIKY